MLPKICMRCSGCFTHVEKRFSPANQCWLHCCKYSRVGFLVLTGLHPAHQKQAKLTMEPCSRHHAEILCVTRLHRLIKQMTKIKKVVFFPPNLTLIFQHSGSHAYFVKTACALITSVNPTAKLMKPFTEDSSLPSFHVISLEKNVWFPRTKIFLHFHSYSSF